MKKTPLEVTPAEFKYLDSLSDLLDSRFRIPGTNIRFGLDFLVGLVPYAGDLVTFGFSGLLVISMARNGASGMVVVKMAISYWIPWWAAYPSSVTSST